MPRLSRRLEQNRRAKPGNFLPAYDDQVGVVVVTTSASVSGGRLSLESLLLYFLGPGRSTGDTIGRLVYLVDLPPNDLADRVSDVLTL